MLLGWEMRELVRLIVMIVCKAGWLLNISTVIHTLITMLLLSVVH